MSTRTTRTKADQQIAVRRHYPDRIGPFPIKGSISPVSGAAVSCDVLKLPCLNSRTAIADHRKEAERVSHARCAAGCMTEEHQVPRRGSISTARHCQAAQQFLACQPSIGNAAAPPITTAPFAADNVGLNVGRARDCAQIAANAGAAADRPSSNAPDLYAPGRDNPLTRCFSISRDRTRGRAPARAHRRRPAAFPRTRVPGVDRRNSKSATGRESFELAAPPGPWSRCQVPHHRYFFGPANHVPAAGIARTTLMRCGLNLPAAHHDETEVA
jgi:hypothetical protein